jgi:hypothetical protein
LGPSDLQSPLVTTVLRPAWGPLTWGGRLFFRLAATADDVQTRYSLAGRASAQGWVDNGSLGHLAALFPYNGRSGRGLRPEGKPDWERRSVESANSVQSLAPMAASPQGKPAQSALAATSSYLLRRVLSFPVATPRTREQRARRSRESWCCDVRRAVASPRVPPRRRQRSSDGLAGQVRAARSDSRDCPSPVRWLRVAARASVPQTRRTGTARGCCWSS